MRSQTHDCDIFFFKRVISSKEFDNSWFSNITNPSNMGKKCNRIGSNSKNLKEWLYKKPPSVLSIFWDYNKNAHSAKWLKCIIMKYLMTPNQDLAKKMGGTYFFLQAEIPNFSLKNLWFLRIWTNNEHKLIRKPILHP